ncbi:MAG: squalene--hopene cyclase [Candidatus Omnitrophica bacterium]|nr:squalene--hopene cyclase [Candidatus Omnitrophota bacterium]
MSPEIFEAQQLKTFASSAQDALTRTIVQARSGLLSMQDVSGYWSGELEADTTLESDTIKFWHFLGRVDRAREQKLAAYILSKQLPAGGWNIYEGGPAELNATVKAYFALKLAGHKPEELLMRKAREVILRLGGLGRVNSFEKTYLAVFGQYPWSQVPSLPPEIILLPNWFVFNVYEVSAWSRTILIPLTLLNALKPRVEVPPGCTLDELWPDPSRKVSVVTNVQSKGAAWRRFFLAVDRMLKIWEATPFKPFRRKAIREAERWLLDHLVDSDGLGAIYPAMINAVFGLKALGYQDGDPILERQIQEVDRLGIEENGAVRLQPCFSPVWDTAIAAYVLSGTGAAANSESLTRANRWLRSKEVRRYGDWAVKNPGVAPTGWYFEHLNVLYPDVDDTVMVGLALERLRSVDAEATQHAIDRARAWTLSMQNDDGGWSSFDKNNNCRALTYFPFADHNAMLDPSACDITGRVLEFLATQGMTTRDLPVQKAIRFLLDRQESDGTWFGRWGVNYIYGTWLALRGLRAVGEPLAQPRYQRAIQWLADHQNSDGGWGETIATYDDPSLRGTGESTAAQTAWAILSFLALGQSDHPAVARGVQRLIQTQQPDGTWQDRSWTGTGFPKVFYLKYHLYAAYFPLLALSEFQCQQSNQGNDMP